MPTGYTAKIYEEDQTTEEFLCRAVKAFFYSFRDLDIGDALPESLSSISGDLEYYKRALVEAQNEFIELDSMSVTETYAKMQEEKEAAVKANRRLAKQYRERRARYEKAIDDIERWKVSSEFSNAVKKFALEQLRGDIKYAYMLPYDETDVNPEAWLATQKERARDRIVDCKRDLNKAQIQLHEADKNLANFKQDLEALGKS